MLCNPILLIKKPNWVGCRALVKTSASWWVVETCMVFSLPDWTFSCTKWQFISMCLVYSWNIGFAAMCKVAWLSQYIRAGFGWLISSSLSKDWSQVSSHVALAIALYSASAEDLETVCCFLDFQDIKELPRNTQKPKMDLLVSGQVPQSVYVKTLSWTWASLGKLVSAKAFSYISEQEGKNKQDQVIAWHIAKSFKLP